MDFNRPINARTIKASNGHPIRNFFIFIGILLILVIGLVCAAPAILSSDAARERCVAFVNNQIAPASLSIESWSFGWFQQQKISGITYTDPALETKAKVKDITVNSLWQLLPIGKITAELHVESPDIALPEIAKLVQKPSEDVAPVPGPAPDVSAPTEEVAPTFALPAWDVSINITLTNARITSPSFPQPLIQQGNLTLSIPSFDQPIQTTLATQLLDATLKAEATTDSPNELSLNGVSLGVLQTSKLSFNAPWIQLNVDTTKSERPTLPNTNISLSINMGQAFTLAQPLNLLPPELTSLSGQLAIAAKVQPAANEQIQAACTVTSRDLACAYDGKALVCDPKIAADVLFTPDNLMAITIRKLNAELPGVKVNGAGTLTDGHLTAYLDSTAFWNTFEPFIGEYPLRKPVNVQLNAKALAQTFAADVKVQSQKQEIGDLSLTVDSLDPVAQTFKSLKLSSHWGIENTLNLVTEPLKNATIAGDLYLNLAAAGALKDLRANVAFALQNMTLETTSWKIREASLLDGKASLTLKEQALSLSNLTLLAPIADLTGSIATELTPQLPLDVTLKGKLMPAKVLNQWRVWGKDEKPLSLAGEIACDATVKKQEQILSLVSRFTSEDFTIDTADAEPFTLPINLNLDVQQADAKTTINQCKFATDGGAFDAAGTFAADTGIVTLNGTLTPDFDQLFTIIPALAKNKENFAVTGRHTRNFSFEAPILQGAAGIINYGKADAEVAFDAVTVPGLNIPQGEVKVNLANGVVTANGDVDVNEGKLFLKPRLNLTTAPMTLTWEKESRILDRVRLTPELYNALLSAVNPLLADSAAPDGFISLTCESLHMPLTEDPLATLDTHLLLQTNNCQLQPNGPLKVVLAALTAKDKTMYLTDRQFAVTVEDGILTTEPITFRIEELTFTCAGSTNLSTQEIDYTLSLPVNEKILGKSLVKNIKNKKTLELPIRGTVQKPQVDTSPLVTVATEAAVEKVKDKYSEKLDKLLQEKVEKRIKTKLPDKEAREEALEDALRGLFKR